MPANTAVRLGEVCARCPVRPECLRDALSETRYTVEGWWGGTSRPERTKSLRQVAAEMAGDGQPIALWSPLGSDGVSSSLGREPRNAMDHAELVERTAQALEADFEARLEAWRAGPQPPADLGGCRGDGAVQPRPAATTSLNRATELRRSSRAAGCR